MNKRKLLVAASLSLVLGGSALYFATRTPSKQVSRPSEGPVSQLVTKIVKNAPAPVSAPVTGKPEYDVALRSKSLVTKDVSAVLPDVNAEISDWRTYDPVKITIKPFPDVDGMTFERKETRTESGRSVWVGRNSVEGAFLVTTATQDELFIKMVVPGADPVSVRINSAGVKVEEAHDGDLDCATPHTSAAPLNSNFIESAKVSAALAPGGVYVDVMFLYDAQTLTNSGSVQSLETQTINEIVAANQVLANSGVTNLEWRFAGLFAAPAYTRDGKLATDLNYMISTTHPLGVFAQQKAVLQGADQVVLLLSQESDAAGMAYVPGHHSVVGWGSTFYRTLAHELAHNFGCHHDRVKEGVADNNGVYSYGHMWSYFDPVFQQTLNRGTIMSYANSTLPYFSNPDVSYQGVALGVAAGQPKAADNARWLRESAAAMANYREEIAAPAISTHPQNTTGTVGSTFNLSVTASGGGLTYQWSKNNVDIVGATSSSYSKTAAANDAGTYRVVVSNSKGTVTSNSANVTINEAPAAPPAAGGGGGGGGGGAPSFWFLGAIGALALIRKLKRN